MKKLIILFSLLIAFSCEDKSSDEDEKVSCNADKLETAMWAEYYKLIDESKTNSGVTQATCTSTKAAIQALRDCMSNDPDLKTDVDAAYDWTILVCN